MQNRVIDGKYALLRELGSGAAGTVYEAENLLVGRRVAIKVLHAELASDAALRTRFVAEARAAAAIGHANVVDIFDLGVARDGSCYIVMELIVGETLETVLTVRGRLSAGYACELVLQVLTGLSAAHARGIVHRDLKPANVIVTHPRPDRPLVKVLDFGIAKGILEAAFEGPNSEGLLLGTPHYMAPEQALGRDVDQRADVYSTAAMLYELLTGRPPCEGNTTSEILTRVVTGEHKLLAELRPDIPVALSNIVETALAVDPRDRPETTDEFAEQLLPFIARAHQPSVVPTFGRTGAPIPLVGRRAPELSKELRSLVSFSELERPRIPKAPTTPRFSRSALPLPLIQRLSMRARALDADADSTLGPVKTRAGLSELGWRVVALVVGCAAGVGFAVWASHF